MLHVLSSYPFSLDYPNNILVNAQIIKFLIRSFSVASPPTRFWVFRRGVDKAFTHFGCRVEGGYWSFGTTYPSHRGPGSVVGIATGYGLDGPGIEPRWGRDFAHLSRPALGSTEPPVQWVQGLSRD